MRFVLSILTLLVITSAAAQKTSKLTVEITDIKILDHKLYIGIYDNENDFAKNTNAVDSVIVTPTKSTVKVVFKHLPEGEYAIAFFQNINDNGKLDTGLFGIPSEPIGISNYDRKAKAPPKFNRAKFEVKNDMKIKIPLVTPPKNIKGKED